MAHQGKIQIANMLITRKCNLSCDYCQLVKDCDNECYPKVKQLWESELPFERWIAIIETIRKNNPECFFIFYGGEPFLYPQIRHIISYCNLTPGVNYTVISNNTDGIQNRINETFQYAGQFKGFTSSVDPELFNPKANKDSDIYKKTIAGYNRLIDMKKNGIASDVVAEITVTNDNMDYLYDTVKALSDNDIFSSITFIDRKKSKWYDFSAITDRDMMVKKSKKIKNILEKLTEDGTLKIHMRDLLLDMYKILPCEMKCKIFEGIHNVTIECDGTFRLCLRIRGDRVPTSSTIDMVCSDGRVHSALYYDMRADYNNYCMGCNWSCMLISKGTTTQILEH